MIADSECTRHLGSSLSLRVRHLVNLISRNISRACGGEGKLQKQISPYCQASSDGLNCNENKERVVPYLTKLITPAG